MAVRRSWLPWLIGTFVLLLAAPVGLLALLRPVTPPRVTAEMSAIPTDAMPSTTAPGGPAPLDLATATWYSLEGGTLRYGTLDGGSSGTVDLEGDGGGSGFGPPWASGPAAGRLLFVNARGDAYGIVNALNGQRAALAGPPGTAADGVLAPGGKVAYVAIRDRATDGGVWRIHLDGSGPPEQVMSADPTLVASQPFVLAAARFAGHRLVLSPDGAQLALVVCPMKCNIRWLDLRSGARRALDGTELVAGDVTGVLGTLIFTRNGSFDVRTSRESNVRGVPILTPQGPAVFAGDSLVAVDGSVTPLPSLERDLRPWEQLEMPGRRGVELPPGWVVRAELLLSTEKNVQPCDGQFVAVRYNDASVVPLPVLGEPPFCG